MKTGRPDDYSPQECELMKSLHGEGKTYREIATAVGRGKTRNAIAGKLKRMGLVPDLPADVRARRGYRSKFA